MYKITITNIEGKVRAEYLAKDYGIYDGDIARIKAVGENGEEIIISIVGVDRVAAEKTQQSNPAFGGEKEEKNV
ncbi:MAG: hypothetical protein AAB851_02940 [Patescibacteria group bacterium]|mgnify:FL=1